MEAASPAPALRGLLGGALARRGEIGLDNRDPRFVDRTIPMLWPLLTAWFRPDVRGMEHIPVTGPVLLVGNHSGGNVAPDTVVFTAAFVRRFGAQRPFFQLAHQLVVAAPWPHLLRRYGMHRDRRGARRADRPPCPTAGGDRAARTAELVADPRRGTPRPKRQTRARTTAGGTA